MHKKKLIIFTDLDGTLLDHHNYSWEAAAPALKRLKELDIPLILCTSKTAAEVAQLHGQLELRTPYITENGGAVISPADDHSGTSSAHFFGKTYTEILALLEKIRTILPCNYTGFNDMNVDEVATATGLIPYQANLSKQRQCSEPLIWQDSDAQLERFTRRLQQEGLKLIRGGRFYHVLDGNTDKGIALKWLQSQLSDDQGQSFTVALGDSPNDLNMLEAADLAVIIPAANGGRLAPRNKKLLHASLPGPAGWNQTILSILDIGV